MNDGLIPNRYAKALYKQAEETSCAPVVYDQMVKLENAYNNAIELKRAVDNPFVPQADKERLLLAAAGAEADSMLHKFIILVTKHNRENFMQSMALAYQKIYRQANNILQAEITTAAALPEEKINEIMALLKSRLDGKTLEVKTSVDPELIGGFVVRLENQVLDASIKNELKKLRLKLLS